MYDWTMEEYRDFVRHLSAGSNVGETTLNESEMYRWNSAQWEQWEQRQKLFESTPLMEQMKREEKVNE